MELPSEVNPLREMGRILVVLGVVVAAIGGVLMLGPRLPFRLGRLPGDIAYQGRNTSFYFPVVTCMVLSAVVSAIFWLVAWLRK